MWNMFNQNKFIKLELNYWKVIFNNFFYFKMEKKFKDLKKGDLIYKIKKVYGRLSYSILTYRIDEICEDFENKMNIKITGPVTDDPKEEYIWTRLIVDKDLFNNGEYFSDISGVKQELLYEISSIGKQIDFLKDLRDILSEIVLGENKDILNILKVF